MILDKFLLERGQSVRGVVHVGANKGQEMERYRAIGVELLVWVEADPAIYADLLKRVAAKDRHFNQVKRSILCPYG